MCEPNKKLDESSFPFPSPVCPFVCLVFADHALASRPLTCRALFLALAFFLTLAGGSPFYSEHILLPDGEGETGGGPTIRQGIQ